MYVAGHRMDKVQDMMTSSLHCSLLYISSTLRRMNCSFKSTSFAKLVATLGLLPIADSGMIQNF